MPFVSQAQSRAAFSGALGPQMKRKAKEFASVTNYSKLPEHVKKKKKNVDSLNIDSIRHHATHKAIFK